MKLLLSALVLSLALLGCEEKKPGFGLEGSYIRYETKTFDDKEVLAETNGQKFTKSQILDKSPVLKDLDQQENEALAALAYLKVVERLGALKPLGQVEVHLPASPRPLAEILNRFDAQPTQGLGLVYKPDGDPELLAVYKDIKLTKEDVNPNHVVLQSIDQRRFQEVAGQLNSQVTRILISEKANKDGKDMQAVLTEIFGPDMKVTDADIFEYTGSIGVAREEVTDDLKERFRSSIKMRKEQKLMEKYVAEQILKGPLYVSFTPPASNLKLNENWKPVMGYKDAPVSMVAFSGITCPDCASFISAVRGVMEKYNGHLKLNWIHNFNENDGIAKMMAESALCIDAVKTGKSVQFMDTFSKTGAKLDETNFYEWAGKNGVDSAAMKRCFTERSKDELISQHLEYAKRVGIVANPTIWVEGRTLQGVISADQLDQLVESMIQAKGSSRFQALVRRIKGWFAD